MRTQFLAISAFLIGLSQEAAAQDVKVCGEGYGEARVAACSRLIASRSDKENWYFQRGIAQAGVGNNDAAISDYSQAIAIAPRFAAPYAWRGLSHQREGRSSAALDDLNKAITLKSDWDRLYEFRGVLLQQIGELERAEKDLKRALQLNRSNSTAADKLSEIGAARADTIRQAEIERQEQMRRVQLERSQREAAEQELKRKADEAALVLRRAMELEEEAKRRVAAATAQQRPTVVASLHMSSSSCGHGVRCIAMAIANSRYDSASSLKNPSNDNLAIAASLRRLGFAEVIEKNDLDKVGLEAALKDFGDKAADADWAVVYYSGHGIQVDGQSYIVPTNAKLARASHVEDEAVPLDRVLSKVRDAKKLRLVILDACRDNPFLPRMQQMAGTRNVSRGLARIEPSSGVLVAYSARDGQLAQDGTNQNSPFTEALLEHLEEPGLEIGLLFRKVRDSVLKKTKGAQEPFVYGSIPSEEMFFKPRAP